MNTNSEPPKDIKVHRPVAPAPPVEAQAAPTVAYTQEQVDQMMRTLKEHLQGSAPQQTQQAAPNVIINNNSSPYKQYPGDFKKREHIPDPAKRLKESVTFVIYQRANMVWPLEGVWDTPTGEPIWFRPNGTNVLNETLVTEAFFETNDPAYVECMRSHPDYGELIHTKSNVTVTAGGQEALMFQRWTETVSRMNQGELRAIAISINRDHGAMKIQLTDDIRTLRAEVIHAKVAEEKLEMQKHGINVDTLEDFKKRNLLQPQSQ